MSTRNIYDLSLAELASDLEAHGQKPFRAKQLYRHLYVHLAQHFDDATDLSSNLKQELDAAYTIGSLKTLRVMEGDDGLTRKALFEVQPKVTIETVLMIYEDRATVCVSSQAGCPMGCTFCATARLGFLVDLSPGQIVEQIVWAAHELRNMRLPDGYPTTLSNVVFMGMGEPFNNYDSWWKAVEILHDPQGFNMGARRFTVSTVGLVPGIERLANETLPINLAISLHSPDDDLRTSMMPVNKSYPIEQLLETTAAYVEKTGRRVSFEYVLLQEENDTAELAELLAYRLSKGPLEKHRTMFHVNLIPWNPVPGSPLGRSHRKRVLAFQDVLTRNHIPCTVRVERGIDIGAACGQLAGAEV